MFKYLPAAAAALALSFAAVPAAEAATVFSGGVNNVQANGADPGLIVQTGNYNTFSLPLEVGVTSAPVGLFSIWTNETAINFDDWAHSPISVQLQFTAPTGPWSGGPVTGDTDDPAFGMGSFARQQQMAFEIAVEGHPVAEQIVHAVGPFRDHQPRHLLLDKPGTGRDRIGQMLVETVARAHGRGDAALRPVAGAVTQRALGDHNHLAVLG